MSRHAQGLEGDTAGEETINPFEDYWMNPKHLSAPNNINWYQYINSDIPKDLYTAYFKYLMDERIRMEMDGKGKAHIRFKWISLRKCWFNAKHKCYSLAVSLLKG